MSTDYRSTVYLLRTDFPMKARLPEREPALLERWAKLGIYRRLREAARGREKFILHDGPPYANGNIHTGTAMNKILKDVVVRSQQMLGKDANYVPGWDCHGLPIEWQVEQRYRKEGRDKDAVPIAQFRDECRAFANKWIAVQSEEFQRLGVTGDWDNPYLTMAPAAEAQIIREIGKFAMNGGLYKGSKPVMWSVVEKTALAEAEIEYHDHTSTTVDVRFPVVAAPAEALEGASVVIWTTTPWTIPGNRGIAYGSTFDYVVFEVTETAEASLARSGERLVAVAELMAATCARAGVVGHREIARLKGSDLAGTVCAHPLRGRGYDFDVPLLAAGHVTLEAGTGLVHIAPGHGAEDFEAGVAFGLEVPQTVDGDGLFFDAVPLFAGQHVFKANEGIADTLEGAGALLARGRITHSYPSFVAVEGAADLPQYAPVVHLHGDQRSPRKGAGRHRRGALGAPRRAPAHPRHDRAAARLGNLAPARLGRAHHRVPAQGDRRAACATRRCSTASPRRSRPRAPTCGSAPIPSASWAAITTPPTTTRSTTSSTCGSNRARRTASCWRRATTLRGPPRSTSKVPTSTAAGSTRRCSNPAAPAAGRPTRRC